MKNLVRSLLIFAVLGTISLPATVFGQVPPADVHVKLLLADNKTTYHIGERLLSVRAKPFETVTAVSSVTGLKPRCE